MANEEIIKKLNILLEEPDISCMDWEIGKSLLNNWRLGLPARILALYKEWWAGEKNTGGVNWSEVREKIAEDQSLPKLRKSIDTILQANVTLHSVRGGYGVFNITSFKEINDQILALIEEALPKLARGEEE